MKTVFSQQNFSEAFSKGTSSSISKAVEILRRGGLVAFPTETVYGLGARVFDPKAISKIFDVKGRAPDNPLIVHVADLNQLALIVNEVPPVAEKLIKAFWPGPLTLILSRAANVPQEVSAGLPTLAVRMPNHHLALELLRCLSEPIAAPSANRSGRPSPTKAEHVLWDLGDVVDMVLDGGLCSVGLESTILDLTEETPKILRHGEVTAEDLEHFIGKVFSFHASREALVKSPGQKHRHYAPNIRVILVLGSELRHACERWKRAGKKIGVFSKEDFGIQKDLLFYRQCEGNESIYAQNLFSAFRDAEAEGIEVLLVEKVDKKGLGLAIMDRLERAAEGSK